MVRFRGRQTQFYIDLIYGLGFSLGFGYLMFVDMDPRIAALNGGLVLGYFLRVWENMVVYERVLEEQVAEEAEVAVKAEVEERVPDEAEERVAEAVEDHVHDEVAAEVEDQVPEEVSAEVADRMGEIEERIGERVDTRVDERMEEADAREG